MLAEVQQHDAYPLTARPDYSAWLNPPELLAAWVAEHDDELTGHIGVASGVASPELAEAMHVSPKDLLIVTRLFTAIAARGSGVARGLLRTATEYADHRPLGLDVVASSVDAISTYRRLGWQQIGSGPATWCTQDGRHPTVCWFVAPR